VDVGNPTGSAGAVRLPGTGRPDAAPPALNPIWAALTKLNIVHFARFVFLENNTKLAVITTYDGTFEDYINDFIDEIGKFRSGCKCLIGAKSC
jgi:hypothetical protein